MDTLFRFLQLLAKYFILTQYNGAAP
jgi:hypothetical protein